MKISSLTSPVRQYLNHFKEEFFSVALLSLITNLLMLAPTLYMLQLYDRVLISKNELTLYAITLITCLLFLVMAFGEWLRSIIVIKAGVRFDQLLSHKLFALGFKSAENAQRTQSNEAMQDLTYIRQFITGNGLFAFFDMPWTLLYIAVLFILHPVVGMLAVGFCLIQLGFGMWNQHSSAASLQALSNANQRSQQFIDNKVRNIETLYVLGMAPDLSRRWQAMQSHWHSLDSNAVDIQIRNQLINKFVRYTMQSLMLGVAALLAIQGKISIGSMIASNVLIAKALQPFDVIVGTWKQSIQARQSYSRLNELLASEKPLVYAVQPQEIKGHLILSGVGVRFENGQQDVLKDINLEIIPGQILTVMGASGSGKTTLIRCLAGICAWQSGEFRIDGKLTSQIPGQHWANSLGYLPQDIGLLEGTIAENIARFSEPDPTEVIAAAKSAGIHETILRLSQGYDTPIRDFSTVLSGGQYQLLGLARAIYRQPALLLLDEPNSHLDEHGESSLLTTLLNLKQQGKAIVLVSHRSNILKITDQLLVMKDGKVQHYGSRDAVVAEMSHHRQKLAVQAA